MGGSHLLHLYNSSRATRMKGLTAYFPVSVRRYESSTSNKEKQNDHGMEERAPSTEEEFKRAAEAKETQGFCSHTLDKAEDGAGEATKGADSHLESVKESHKEPPGKGNFHRTGDGVPAESIPRHI